MRETTSVKGSECNVPSEPGVYRFVNRTTGEIIYIGQTENLRKRLQQHASHGILDLITCKVQYGVARQDATRDDLLFAERTHIERHQPHKNKYGGGNGRRLPTDEVIASYLKQIAQTPPLRAAEEGDLGCKITELSSLEFIRENLIQKLDREPDDKEWAEAKGISLINLRTSLHQGRQAKDRMVKAHLRLVVWNAEKYVRDRLSLSDLIQEGCFGLIQAAEDFDYEKGYKFSTYASFYIKQAIDRAVVDQSNTIRLPNYIQESFINIQMVRKSLLKELRRRPTDGETAKRLEISVEELRFITQAVQLPLSFASQEKSTSLTDCIDVSHTTPEEEVAKSLLKEALESVLQTLTPPEHRVLKLRYGLDDGRMKTLEEIGQIFNVTRERIRQIEAKALSKLRHSNRNSVLREYLE